MLSITRTSDPIQTEAGISEHPGRDQYGRTVRWCYGQNGLVGIITRMPKLAIERGILPYTVGRYNGDGAECKTLAEARRVIEGWAQS